jgi:hypothetical protein
MANNKSHFSNNKVFLTGKKIGKKSKISDQFGKHINVWKNNLSERCKKTKCFFVYVNYSDLSAWVIKTNKNVDQVTYTLNSENLPVLWLHLKKKSLPLHSMPFQ